MNDQYIPVTNTPRSITLAALEQPHSFTVLIPTEAELDNLGFELFRHNIAPITQETYRAAIITAIFDMYDEGTAEDYATLLDAHWSASELYQQQLQDWQIHEDIRLEDMLKQPGLEIEQRLRPEYTMGIRDRAKAVEIATEVAERSPKLRDLTIKMQTFPQRQNRGLVRLLLDGWEGVGVVFAKENGIVPEATYDELRDKIGKRAIAELEMKALQFDRLNEHEKGNSDSPLANSLDQSSSQEPIGALDSSDGTSPTETKTTDAAASSSPSTPTPDLGSAVTTGEPSPSTTGSDGAISSSESTPAATPSPSPAAS